MSTFSRLVHFETADDKRSYFADLGADTLDIPAEGSQIKAYSSFDDLGADKNAAVVTIGKVKIPPL